MHLTLEAIDGLRTGGSDRQILGEAARSADDWFMDYGTYGWYFAVGAATKAEMILEIGVRYGYGLIAMAKGAISTGQKPQLFGIDGENDGVASNAIAGNAITSTVGNEIELLRIIKWDTATPMPRLAWDFNKRFDLIHVDADHSREGIRRELDLAGQWVKPSGCVLVDDCDAEWVKAEVLEFCSWYAIVPFELPTFHKTMVIDFGQR